MNKEMMAYCGTYCETCDWKDRMSCRGCKAYGGNVFWGKCKIAICAVNNGYTHCGECTKMPCEILQEAFNNPDHGDNGERIINLRNWAMGKESCLKVRSTKK